MPLAVRVLAVLAVIVRLPRRPCRLVARSQAMPVRRLPLPPSRTARPMFGSTQKNKVTGATPLAGGASLVGIDVRPADGGLIRNDGGRHHRHARCHRRGLGARVKQAPPSDGTRNTIAQLGVKFTGPVAFDIVSDGKGGKTGWLLVDGALYTVDLVRSQAGRARSAISPSCPLNEKATAGHQACRRFLTQTAWRPRAVTRRWVRA